MGVDWASFSYSPDSRSTLLPVCAENVSWLLSIVWTWLVLEMVTQSEATVTYFLGLWNIDLMTQNPHQNHECQSS